MCLTGTLIEYNEVSVMEILIACLLGDAETHRVC